MVVITSRIGNDVPGVLRNDVDRDWNPLTALEEVGPSFGDLLLNLDGSFTYTPNKFFDGEDSFTYRACDDVYCSEPVTVTITDASNIFLPLILR